MPLAYLLNSSLFVNPFMVREIEPYQGHDQGQSWVCLGPELTALPSQPVCAPCGGGDPGELPASWGHCPVWRPEAVWCPGSVLSAFCVSLEGTCVTGSAQHLLSLGWGCLLEAYSGPCRVSRKLEAKALGTFL